MADVMPISAGGGSGSGGSPLASMNAVVGAFVAPGEAIEYRLDVLSSSYMASGLADFGIDAEINFPLDGVDESGIGIRAVIESTGTVVPDAYWMMEPGASDSTHIKFVFDCLNPYELGSMWGTGRFATFVITVPTSPDIETGVPVTAEFTVSARGAQSGSLTTGELSTEVLGPAQGPLLLTATDPVSWAPAGTLPALGATRETREVNPIPDLGTYPFGPGCGTDLITTLTNLLANWDPISNGLMDPGDPAAPTDDNYRNVWEAYVTLATHVLDQMSVDMPGVWDQYNAYLEENEAPPLAMPEDGDFEGSLVGNIWCSYDVFSGYGGESFGTLDAEAEATKGAMFTEFMRVLADNSSKEVWAFVLEGGYFDDLAEYIPAESTVETCELEWRTPSGLMLSTDGWVEIVEDLTALRSEIDALVQLYFMSSARSYVTLGGQYSSQVLNGAQYEPIAHLFSDIGEGIFEREFSVTMKSSSPTIQTVFKNVYDAHDGASGWEGYWPTDRVDQMDKQRLGEIAERLRDLSGQFIALTDGMAQGGPLDWDVLMDSGEYPEVAAL